ncbi:MAG: DinB family protein [Rhodospirillales bacterium]
MIAPAHAQTMARYNKWQNQNLYACAARLTEDERRAERGAFFGSIHKTLNHLLWGDRIWLHRFAGTARPEGGIPESVGLVEGWADLRRERAAFDEAIIRWADGLDPRWLAGDLTYYSGAAKRDITKPKWLLVTHLFNHQTHHRGQVHCLLTQAGQRPHATDLAALP